MASRSGHRRVDHSSPLVDLDDVFADDALIDALAASPWGAAGHPQRLVQASDGRHATPATAEPLVELFDNWRLELAQQPIPDLPPLPKAVVVSGGPRPRRPHRPALAVAAAIAALLVGSTFVGSRQAAEGSALWNVTAVLWPDRVESVASRNRVQTAIEVAQVALNEGRPADAQAALLGASFEIGKVDDADGRQDLQSSLEGLWKQAAPAGSPPAPSELRQLEVGGAPSSTAHSTTTPAAQQVAALEVVPPSLTGVQIAVPEVLPSGPGSAGSVGVIGTSTPGGANGGLAGISAAATAAAPVVSSEIPDTDVKTPSATVEPPATVDQSTDPPTIEAPSSVTEPAPAPTPSLPTPTVESSGTATADGTAAQGVSGLTGDSSSMEATYSTAVLPTP